MPEQISKSGGKLFILLRNIKQCVKNFEFDRIADLVEQSRSVIVTSHHNPDGDAIGSLLALTLVLQKLGKKVSPIVPNDYPKFLKWLPGNERIIIFEKDPERSYREIVSADLIFCLDYNALHRTGEMQEAMRKTGATRILIDHHLEPVFQDFNLYYSLVETSSTSELLFGFIERCGWKHLIDKESATGLYVGIMTDTGSFSYSCDYPETFKISSELIRTGISPTEIHRLVYDTYSENRLRLLGYCLSEKLTILEEYHTAYIALTQDELNRFGHQVGDTEGVVNYALSIEGIKLAVLLTERNDRIRISFRSRGSFSVNTFARDHFNGGGHMNAAGGDSFASVEQTIGNLKRILSQYKGQLDRS